MSDEHPCGHEWSQGALGILWRCVSPPHPETPDMHRYVPVK